MQNSLAVEALHKSKTQKTEVSEPKETQCEESPSGVQMGILHEQTAARLVVSDRK